MSGVLPPKLVQASLILSFIVSDAYIEAASNGIEIWFGHTEVEYGNRIWIEDLKKEPTLINWVHNNEDRFTLIMSGLDAPSSDDPGDQEVLYWLVGNIPETDIEAGEQWAAYVPPWPLGGVELQVMNGKISLLEDLVKSTNYRRHGPRISLISSIIRAIPLTLM